MREGEYRRMVVGMGASYLRLAGGAALATGACRAGNGAGLGLPCTLLRRVWCRCEHMSWVRYRALAGLQRCSQWQSITYVATSPVHTCTRLVRLLGRAIIIFFLLQCPGVISSANKAGCAGDK